MAADNKFTDVLNMSTLGDKLREVREGKNLTLSQAQKQTRIHLTILKALEDGNCDSILNPTYVKSFLKKYSEYLGLDSNQVINEYKRLHPEAESASLNKISESEGHFARVSNVISIIKLILVGVIVLALITFLFSKVIPYISKHGNSKSTSTSRSNKAPAQAKATKKSQKASTSSKKDVSINIPKNVQLKLLLKVKQDVLIKMRTDGVLLFERVLPKGTAEVFTADNVINIYAANGQYIELVLNGKPIGSLEKGPLKNIEITRAGVKLK